MQFVGYYSWKSDMATANTVHVLEDLFLLGYDSA